MKITKKYLRKVIKEELQKMVNESALTPEKQIIAAVIAGFGAKKIALRVPPKITDVRRYKGGGTGFTIEVETDIGSVGKFIDPEASDDLPQGRGPDNPAHLIFNPLINR